MNPASKDIANFLDEQTALGLTLGIDLFYSRMPDNPSDCVAIFDNPGEPPMLAYDKSISNYFYSSVSVQVRSIDYSVGWGVMFEILTFLHAARALVTEESSTEGTPTKYMLIRAMNDPQVLHWDENDRVIFFVNFEIQRKPNN